MDGISAAQAHTLASPTSAFAADGASLGGARHLADTLGPIVAGPRQPTLAAALAVVDECGGDGDAPAIATGRRVDPPSASRIVAVGAYVTEPDRRDRGGPFRSGAVVVPAAVGAGYKVAGRIARALHPDAGRRSFQTTGAGGVRGSATVAEAGVTDYDSTGCFGLFAPASTPEGIVQRSTHGLAAFARRPDVAARIGALGAEPITDAPGTFAAMVRAEIDTRGDRGAA